MQAFLGFANFYRRFIRGFSHITKALTALTKTDGQREFPLAPDSLAMTAFNKLKTAFGQAGVLAHFDADLETWLETDASDFVTAAILSQMGKDNVLRPVAFLSHKMSPAECNYEIYDKELLAIVKAFEEWRFELSGTEDPIHVLSDHQALQTFMTTKQLNRRQADGQNFCLSLTSASNIVRVSKVLNPTHLLDALGTYPRIRPTLVASTNTRLSSHLTWSTRRPGS